MGRIDKALSRAGDEPTALTPGPTAEPQSDVFESPWSFDAGERASAPDVRESEVPTTVPTSPVTGLPREGALALFRGFKPEMLGRLVSTPSTPPLLAERYRRLAASLHHAQLVNGLRTVLITSANGGDGKTLTSANLALTLSQSYRRQVLLIDADLRRPSLHDVFNVPNVNGLNDGLKAAHDARLNVIKISDTLTLLPAGRPDPDPMSTLTSPRMAEILREASERFDWIIVDTAPLGLLADASLLSRMVDGTLFVVRAHQTPFAAVQTAIEALGKEHILGVVLNAVDTSDDKGSEYYTREGAEGTASTAVVVKKD
jgi:capsular exopolysaccharide synthesis family protein